MKPVFDKVTLKNKKAFLLGEYTLKIVIAVLCILLLVYLLGTLYATFSDERALAQARSTMNRLEQQMALVSSEQYSGEALREVLLGPKGWMLKAYVPGQGPRLCEGQSCICLCAQPRLLSLKSQEERCEQAGTCKRVAEQVAMQEIVIREATNMYIRRTAGGLSIGTS